MGRQWHQLGHIQVICTSLKTDNDANMLSLNFFTGQILFLTPNQQCQSTEGNIYTHSDVGIFRFSKW